MNEIVTRDRGALIQQSKDDWGLVAEGSGSLAIRCTVGQPSNKTKLKSGAFNFSNPEWLPQEKLENVVIVSPQKTRVLYGKEFNGKRRCGSDNFATPSQFIVDPVSSNCFECPLSSWDSALSEEQKDFKHKWAKDLGKDEKHFYKPTCTETINLIVVDERLIPFTLKFQKTQIKVVQEKLINRIRFKGKRPYQVSFSVSLNQKSGESYFDYVFDNFVDIPSEEQGPFEDLFNLFKEHGEIMLAQQVAQMDFEKEVGLESRD